MPDSRLNRLASVVQDSERLKSLPPEVPATVEFVDIAGIVAGAHKGEGLGNKFLSHIREVDLVAHVIRDFSDEDVVQTGKGLKDDFEIIVGELILRDLESVEQQLLKLKKDRSKEAEQKKNLLNKLIEGFNRNKKVTEILSDDERLEVKEFFLLTAKPFITVVNVSDSDLQNAENVQISVAEELRINSEDVVVISAKIESEISVLNDDDSAIFMEELGIKESGLERLIRVAYKRLGLISFLTAGEKEVRAWTIKNGMTAPESSGAIHTDFVKKFIKAEVVSFSDFVNSGGWKNARDLGKVRLEGKSYLMKDGDVVDFKIGG